MKAKLSGLILCTFLAPLFAVASPSGKLVVVGGALRQGNADVHRAFIDAARLDDELRIGIFPTASGNPARSAERFRESLIGYGVPADAIEVFPIAVLDDPSTAEVDEFSWRDNARQTKLAERAARLTGAWFVGGDQTRIAEAFLDAEGGRTPVLKALDMVLARGGVIGGTSAGAAMQSARMIAGGDSAGALLLGVTNDYTEIEEQESGGLSIRDGLGFFPYGIVDQHFDRKARLGRLVVALLEDRAGADRGFGFGVDEDTAMVVDLASGRIRVVGTGFVSIVDVREAEREGAPPALRATGIRLSMLSDGDSWDVERAEARIDPSRKSTRGREYLAVSPARAGGVLSPYAVLGDFLTYLLIDNRKVEEAVSYLWNEDGDGYRVRFAKDGRTEGFWGYADGESGRYSAVNILMDLQPVSVKIENR